MNQDDCPLAARGMLTASSSSALSLINSHRTSSALDSRLWIATPVLIPASWRRTGKRASLTGGLAPTPATPMPGRSKRSTPPMAPNATTRTDPLTSSPWPWVEIVSSPSGSIAVWMLKPAVLS